MRPGSCATSWGARSSGSAGFVEQFREVVAAAAGLPPAGVAGTGRSPRVARAGAAYLWCLVAGHSGRVLAAALGVSHQAVPAAMTRSERTAPQWQAVWRKLQ